MASFLASRGSVFEGGDSYKIEKTFENFYVRNKTYHQIQMH